MQSVTTHRRDAEGTEETQRAAIFSAFGSVSSAPLWWQKIAWRCRLAICLLAVLFPFSFFILPCSAQGVITTVAGGAGVFRGDGGPAANAPLGNIQGGAVDSAGNVFGVDRGNHLVVKLSSVGVLTGNGFGERPHPDQCHLLFGQVPNMP